MERCKLQFLVVKQTFKQGLERKKSINLNLNMRNHKKKPVQRKKEDVKKGKSLKFKLKDFLKFKRKLLPLGKKMLNLK